MSKRQQVIELITSLTETTSTVPERRRALHEFARTNGWHPSEEIDEFPGTADLATGHLVVEHGLDNTAVISFLKIGSPFGQLDPNAKLRLLSLSYNNLVDWQFFPDKEGLNWMYNRTDPPSEGRLSVHEYPDTWGAEAFDIIVGRKPNPNVKALDDALITTIADWKRRLPVELAKDCPNENISALFNSLLFVRALEDSRRRQGASTVDLLTSLWNSTTSRPRSILACITSALDDLELRSYPTSVLGQEHLLQVFAGLDRSTVTLLLKDFYDNRFAPYRYDFSVISKHALSRIYEQYMSVLRETKSPQMRLFKDISHEFRNKAIGGIYTPQYIARFFGRFLKETLTTPAAFRRLKVADPACGSGIFLRTILEMQCDPSQDIDVRQATETAFGNTLGIDVDPNACQATRLSLALLHLVLTRQLPKDLNVVQAEAVEYFENNPVLKGSQDAILANPPYIKWDHLTTKLQERFSGFLGPLRSGKIDASLAHIKLGLEMVKPGGFLLYVLPHSFLLAENALPLRKKIASEFGVRFLADLSEISVFQDVGSYVILLILQKNTPTSSNDAPAVIVKCKEFVGHALQDAIEGKRLETDFYAIYELGQEAFQHPTWQILSPKQLGVRQKIEQLPPLGNFLWVREGFVTAADDVFIRDRGDVSPKEMPIYRPYLPDRDMCKYNVPPALTQVVFYPYIDNTPLKLEQLRDDFAKTFKYLEKHKEQLERRKAVAKGEVPWWRPTRPRKPDKMMFPKIITPHLAILPRFSVDLVGEITISHSPLLHPKDARDETVTLLFFLAVLNSTAVYWQLANSSHKYARGYMMLEKKTLDAIRVPDPSKVPTVQMKAILDLVRQRLASKQVDQDALERRIDRLVLYAPCEPTFSVRTILGKMSPWFKENGHGENQFRRSGYSGQSSLASA